MDENKNHMPETIPYVVHESEVARLERTIKRLFIICVLLIIVAVGTNAYWIWYEAQWQDEVITQEIQQDSGEGGYSQMRRPMYYNDGEMMPMNGNSYQRRDSMGRYSNRYNWNKGYDNRYGGYSREGELANRLQSLMDEATTDREREAIRNALNQI